jgi:ABC-2 type transport system ATP-binding protein
MAQPLLELEAVRVRYGEFLALRGISLVVEGGQLLGLIGPNGAGKSTTLRASAGLQPLATGTIRVMGRDVSTHDPEFGRFLGFSGDTPALYDTLSVEDFLRFIAYSYGLSGPIVSERIGHWLDALWLSERRQAKISSLSHGMRRRLAIARTLLPDPHVILMDEPANGLDPKGRVQFRLLLASLRDQGKAIIVSSHILADLAEYCTHAVIMEHGRILQSGTIAAVAGGHEEERSRYRIVLAHRTSDERPRMADIPGLEKVEIDGDVITLEYPAGREAAAKLLAALVAAGLPVSEFQAMRLDLEQAYLRAGVAQVD